MAKLSFSKLNLKLPNEITKVIFNGQEIEIKNYLPLEDKLGIVGRILNLSAEDQKYYNVAKIEVYLALEIMYNYTNLTFTEKQKENVYKLYDLIISSGLYQAIITEIPYDETAFIKDILNRSIKSIYDYNNSALGILDSMTTDYNNLNFDIDSLQKKLSETEDLDFLKDVMTKLG